MSDEIFRTRSGEAWRRIWVTGATGRLPAGESPAARYEWSTCDKRLTAWCESRRFEDDPVRGGRHPVQVYRAALDGQTSPKSWPTLPQAMAAVEQARWLKDYREREKAA